MNLPEKVFCRAFQQVMHAAIPILPYRKPHVLHHIGDVPAKLRELGCTCALLVTDNSVRSLGLTKPLEAALAAGGIGCVVFETIANPTTDLVEEAVRI